MKKKIVFVVSTPYTAKAFLENHFEKLSGIFEIHLIANLNEEDLENYNHPNLTSVKNIGIERKINLIQDCKALWHTTSYFKKNKFDAVICFTPKAGLVGIIAAKLAGIKNRIHFFTGQVWYTKKGLFKEFLKLLDKIVVSFSTDIIVDGRPQQEFLIKNKIVTENNSIILGKGTISGIDVEKFSAKSEIRINIRKSLKYNEQDLVFMFLGRLNKDKGILDLIKAFNNLQKTQANIKLLIVGPDEENISNIIESDSINIENITFYGITNEPENLMQVCDVFCLPSHREAFGLSIIEASACNKPIICSDTYGLKDSIIDDETGLRHETYNIDSIFKKMQFLIKNPDSRIKLGNNGRKYVENNFSKEIITNLWLKYFLTKIP